MYSYLDTPLDPYGDYGEQEKELERQRQLALALYKNVISGANKNAEATGPYNGIAAFLGQALGGLGVQSTERDLAARQAEIDRNRMEADRKFRTSMPQITPGSPGGDMAADGMGPPTPELLPKRPTPQQYAEWAGGAPRTVGSQKLAQETMESMLPLPLKDRYSITPTGGAFDRELGVWGAGASPDVLERQRLDREQKADRLQADIEKADALLQSKGLDRDQRQFLTLKKYELDQQKIDLLGTRLSGGNIGDPSKMSEGKNAYISTLDPGDAALIDGVVAGKIPLSTFSKYKGEQERFAKMASIIDPGFNPVSRAAAWKDFTSPNSDTAKRILAVNTVIPHIETLGETLSALNNGDFRPGNAAYNYIAKQFGAETVTNPQAAVVAVSTELMKAFRGTGVGSQKEIEDWENALTGLSGSPAQQKGVLQTLGKLIGGRIQALNDQWRVASGSQFDFPDLVPPQNVDILKNLGVGKTGMDRPAPKAATALPSTNVPGQTDTPLLESIFNQYKAAGKTTPEAGNGPMLPQTTGGGAPMSISSKAEYDALPHGAKYIAPDGSVRTKP